MMARTIILLLGALALASCGGGPRDDWRAALGRPQPNAVVVTPAAPLALPATLDLPPPARPAS